MPQTLKEKKDLEALKSTVATVAALLSQLEAAVKTPRTPRDEKSINALALANDAAKLIRAHSTKLSLLIINKPFTPTAISSVLRELAAGPLPALVTATEVCDSAAYTNIARSELIWRVQKVLSEFGNLLRDVPLDGQVLNTEQKNGSAGQRGSLAATGVVWQACDSLMELHSKGIAGFVVKKAEEYRDTLKDAIEELQEWAVEESDDENDDGDDHDETTENDPQDEIDAMFGESSHIPSSDPAMLRPRLESSLRKMKLAVLLYNAAIKRRLRNIPTLPLPTLDLSEAVASMSLNSSPATAAQRLGTIMSTLRQIPDCADELANAFYELDPSAVDERIRDCFTTAISASGLLATTWDGKDDEFTTWVRYCHHPQFSSQERHEAASEASSDMSVANGDTDSEFQAGDGEVKLVSGG